ncbi:hypothetical protein L7F22_042221 [Adiantum nelumboides]|nr:hypothetical protein [Adiantum nelumboides]
MLSKVELEAFFENAEELYLDALRRSSTGSFLAAYKEACDSLATFPSFGCETPSAAKRMTTIAERIRTISHYLLDITKQSDRLTKIAIKETKNIFTREDSSKDQDKQDSLNSQFLRRWFLEHIGHPFPSTEVKTELAELTNAKLKELESRDALPKYGPASAIKPITKNQCQLWFINTRRRSTWTEFYREYAFSDETIMTKLVSILKGGSENTNGTTKALARLLAYGENRRTKEWSGDQLKERVHNCKQHWIVIMEWLEQRPHEQQSDWLSQAIEEATSEYDQLRRSKRDEQRKIREFRLQKARAYQSDDDDDDDDADQVSSRKRAKKGKTIERPAKPAAADRRSRNGTRNARRPSKFKSASNRDRNVSGSSTSTLDTTCSSISTSSYTTASSPLANYGTIQDSSKQQDAQSLYHQPGYSSSNPVSNLVRC